MLTSKTATTLIPNRIDQQLATHNIFMALLVGICFMAFVSFCLFKLRKLFFNKKKNLPQLNNFLCQPPPSYSIISPKMPHNLLMENAIKIDLLTSPSKIYPTKNDLYNVDLSNDGLSSLTPNLPCNSNRWRRSLIKTTIKGN